MNLERIIALALGINFALGCQHHQIEDGIDSYEVRQTIRKSLPKFKDCFEKERKSDPFLQGKATLTWEIHNKGEVKNARINEEKTTIKNEDLRDCLVRVMSSLKFPDPADGTIAEITYPFLFQNSNVKEAK